MLFLNIFVSAIPVREMRRENLEESQKEVRLDFRRFCSSMFFADLLGGIPHSGLV